MKRLLLTLITTAMFIGVATAECTVTTDCGTFTYDVTEVSASASNGVITVTSEGNIIDEIACEGTSVSSSCSSSNDDDNGNGDYNICDYLPAWLASFFGCS